MATHGQDDEVASGVRVPLLWLPAATGMSVDGRLQG